MKSIENVLNHGAGRDLDITSLTLLIVTVRGLKLCCRGGVNGGPETLTRSRKYQSQVT